MRPELYTIRCRGKYINIYRLNSLRRGSYSNDASRSKSSNLPIYDITLQRSADKTNAGGFDATYTSEALAIKDMQDAIIYIRSELNAYKKQLADLEAESGQLGVKPHLRQRARIWRLVISDLKVEKL